MKKSIFCLLTTFLMFSCKKNNENQHSIVLNDTTHITSPNNLRKPEGVTFQVDEVKLANEPLKTFSADHTFGLAIGNELLFYPEEHKDYLLVPSQENGFVSTLQYCYDQHRPLVLSPDAIWMTICQGVSYHINENYNSLKGKLFKKNKPEILSIRNDSLEFGAKHWNIFINDISNKTRIYTRQDYYNFFVGDYSTTTPVIKTAYQISLLNAYKKGFDYIAETGCGIPSITITGTKEDWEKILEKIQLLNQLGLEDWHRELAPIIEEFKQASQGKIHHEFWKNIYKNATEYNGFYISGWMIKLFPYIKLMEESSQKNSNGDIITKEVLKRNPFLQDDFYLKSTLTTDNFPSGILKVPVSWENYNKKTSTKLQLCSGFFGISQYQDKALEPLISWAVASLKDYKKTNESHPVDYSMIHRENDWSPNFASFVLDSAIYDYKTNATTSKSLAFIKSYLLTSLAKDSKWRSLNLENDTLKIEVLVNGKVGAVSFSKTNNTQLNQFVYQALRRLPAPWLPARATVNAVLELMQDESLSDKKIRVNSLVAIAF
ncbi:MAG: DUF4419 domain-containing protein [Flectobacillus sp.]|uniref:DUF4419 domain-containing protein n=1 Tax=Flectobacillus sp. TaxID=50419 RepID=UPI003B9D538E